MRPPSYKDIADRAGVSTATVSFALGSNVRKVSPATRERIIRLANEMGYQRNPMRSAWQAQVRARREGPVRAALAWINDHEIEDWWDRNPHLSALREGAHRKARQLGYRFDEIWLPDMDSASPEDYAGQCLKVLRARGLFGVLLPHLWKKARSVVDWSDCAVVVVGKMQRMRFLYPEGAHPLDARHPQIHHGINPDYFYNSTTAFRSLSAAGYQRIGLAICHGHDVGSDDLISAAFQDELRYLPADRQVPILRFDRPGLRSVLKPWINKYRPDAILATVHEMKTEIERLGRRIPDEIGLAHLDVKSDVHDWSGINLHWDVVGETAVNLLTTHLERNETGIPEHATEMLIKGSWVNGKTTRIP